MEETLCFENENTKVITSLEEKREYGILAHSANQLSILAKKVLLEMPLYMDNISSDFRDKPYLNFSFSVSLLSTIISHL